MFERLRAFADLYRVPADNAEMAQAQVKEMARRMPLVYLITAISAINLAFTHFELAPLWLTMFLPLLLIAACLARVAYWIKDRNSTYTHEAAIARLRASVRLGGLMGLAFVAWCLSLYPYGGEVEHGYIAFFYRCNGRWHHLLPTLPSGSGVICRYSRLGAVFFFTTSLRKILCILRWR